MRMTQMQPISLELISEKLSSDSPDERLEGLMTVSQFRLQPHLDQVIDLLLHDSVEKVRERAAWTLDALNNTNALSALIEAMYDPSWSVRSGAGWALVHLGKVVAPETQRILAESHHPGAREMATLVLQRI